MKIVVGSRGSKLALTQTRWVIEKLKELNEDVEFQIKVIKTKGDKILDVALDKIGDKGLFVKEIENELLKLGIDMAIHSMKDMPSTLPEGLKFASIPKREDRRDVLILREGIESLEDIPKGGKIGTGSKRRKYQILKVRPDLNIVSIRGNIDTRIKKIKHENLDGVILAAAGVKRLGLEEKIGYYFKDDEILPAPAQGALAIEIREKDEVLENMIKKVRHEETEIQIKAERSFLKHINGSCHIPVGAVCSMDKEEIVLTGLLGTEDGSKMVKKVITGKLGEEELIGRRLAREILEEMK